MNQYMYLIFNFKLIQFGFILLLQSQELLSATIRETLILSEGIIAPDNFAQPGILVNGTFPGPPIILNKGDTLKLLVVNQLDHPFSLHQHGILQRGTVKSDGSPFITQDPIPSNSSYLYTTHYGNQTGTYIYHAHSDLDLVFAHGPLIIRDGSEVQQNPIYTYDEERILIVSQCWHVPMSDILDGLEGSPFEDVPETSSLLINGRSWGLWNNSTDKDTSNSSSTNQGPEGQGYEVITVKQGLRYRFRVIGMGVDSMLRFSIENHTAFDVIEVDGILTDPVRTERLDCNSAQRYSVLIKMDQPIGNYWITNEMYPGPGPMNGKAILHYEGAPNPWDLSRIEFKGETDELELDHWILNELHPSTSLVNEEVYKVPREVDREIVIRSQQINLPDNSTRFDINGILLRPHNEGPTLITELEAGRDIIQDERNGVFEILEGERIQIVFENSMSDDGECEPHPWHLHGHTFYVVAEGSDSYDEEGREYINQVVANKTNFLFRDVVTLFPAQEGEGNTTAGASCGWIAIRLIADNPGLWLSHCHLAPHQIMGKHFVLYEHPANSTDVSYWN